MKTTAAVLHTLQDYYGTLAIRPSVKEIARIANMPVATANRYLNGTTQQGEFERVRALCAALDRHDLLDELPKAPQLNSFQDAMALILEVKKESRESNLEQLEQVRKSNEESEKRWERIVEGKDKSIEILSKRIDMLEKDKEKQASVNEYLNSEIKLLYAAKRKREAALIVALLAIIVMLVCIVAYLVRFDIPMPGYGLFG